MRFLVRLLIISLLAISGAACSASNALPLVQATLGPTVMPSIAPASSQAMIVATAPSLATLGAKDMGPASAAVTMSLAITLRYQNTAALDRLVVQQSTLGSALYRHWLTNAQFKARFAPSATNYAEVARSLRSAGFHIDMLYDNRTVIDATVTSGIASRYFRTSIHRVETQSGSGYVNIRPAYAPAGLRALLLSVDGLNTVPVVHTDHVLLSHGPDSAKISADKSGLYGPVSSVTGARGYGPLAFSGGYDLPSEHAGPAGLRYNGSGRASGIIIDADFADSDLHAFLKYFGVDRTGPATKRVLIHGGPPPGDSSNDSVEAALDAEALIGNAPGTALSVFETTSLSNPLIVDAFNTAVSENAVDSVNTSFGGCEVDIGTKTVQALNALAEQGAAKGITFHASSGDLGGSLCANAPASLPYAVAVGGTALTVGSGGAWAQEIAWSGSGGGLSTIFGRPSWQAAVGGTVDLGRNVPDIALDADPETGMAFFFRGSWNTQYNPLGGTSLSSPIYGAAIAEINQFKNGRTGLGSSSLFGFFAANGYASGTNVFFHDIVQGSNGAFGAGPGYDLVTGIGSLDAWNIAQSL